MNIWNKPIRINNGCKVKEFDRESKTNNRQYGITNWMVGTCVYPWTPWVQIHIGYWSIQIKWYLIVAAMCGLSFIGGTLIN
ncbi:hypothetical protein [Paenibacillus sp. Marseille-Q4541]|uniref:hypothetical protein n=1 Tax=Paenibacillus sp. Marseille-Q4541 TaxID=2831522 RepID=UPI001BAAEEAE|nr:hypothetical protein [Paenibacillus sp. Marseille-Q4541]